ncbi:MAG: SDR family oxidoreductase [Alphaproteobacteria bacterium PRO2]|nr:SDR family oxidoreductase [Alphaproteobacteria bacterium PRO2]
MKTGSKCRRISMVNIPQHQNRQPGHETEMIPEPQSFMENYKAAGKLEGKVALVTGGDSGIGRAVCIAFAKEGADVAFIYLEENEDAEITAEHIEQEGARCVKIRGDIGDKGFCEKSVASVIKEFGRLDILVNNAAEQHPEQDFEKITEEQLHRTFSTNIFGMMFMTQAALPHLKKGAAIINTASITAYQGHPKLVDYSATKGAVVTFTRSLADNLVSKKIRVNAVAPGPIWTPLIPSTFGALEVATFGTDTPMKRPGQPDEVAPSFVFLACDDSSYMTGQVLHPNGGTVVNG